MIVLGIETSCDETSCAVVENGHRILSNVVATQIDLHAQYGGVVPELCCRRHVDVIIPALKESLSKAHISLEDVDLIAVAHGPGLIGALLIGVSAAKSLSVALNKPFLGVNHIEAHLYAALMSHPALFTPSGKILDSGEGLSAAVCSEALDSDPIPQAFPALGIVLSGGHTALAIMNAIGDYQLIGETVDDAIGEAFDKVAKLLGLPYPGGPEVEALALKGNSKRFAFKAGRVKEHPFSFSFSGLKTAVLYALKGQDFGRQSQIRSDQDKADLCASFQKAAFDDIIAKASSAAREHGCRSLVFGGGVTNNQELRRRVDKECRDFAIFWPAQGLSLDNAAMIAGLGYHLYLHKGQGDELSLEPVTRLPLA